MIEFSQVGFNGQKSLIIKNEAASAQILLQGAHVVSFVPQNGREMFWLSALSIFESGIAVRGGIPICWPWFGTHPVDPWKPAHGFARISEWTYQGGEELSPELTVVTLELRDNASTRQLWDYSFRLIAEFRIGHTLQLELRTENCDVRPFCITEAAHAYFPVDDITKAKVNGLDGALYCDKLTRPLQYIVNHGDIAVNAEYDTVYLNSPNRAELIDAHARCKTIIEKSGANSTIVWNPWSAKSAKMKDFPDDGYKSMICIESANAMSNAVMVKPGETHTLRVEYRQERL